MLRDEGVLLFCIVVPIVYPLLYSWVYNNENIHEVPVAVVDQSHSQLSRQFIRMCDASPDVHVAYYAVDLDDAQSLVSRQIVKGIYLIPEDFATRVNRLEQATVSVYCDMALMLTYKAIYQTAQPSGTGYRQRLLRHGAYAHLQGDIPDGDGSKSEDGSGYTDQARRKIY